jgi:hypothetical protein
VIELNARRLNADSPGTYMTSVVRLLGMAAAAATQFCTLRADLPYEMFPLVEPTTSRVSEFNGPGESADYAKKVVVSASGKVFVMGQSIEVGVQSRMFLQCFDSTGLSLWEQVVELNGFYATELLVDAADNSYAIGQTKGNAGLSQSQDVVVMKFNASGVPARPTPLELDYTEPLVNPTFSENAPRAAALASNGNIYISGYVSEEFFAEPTAQSHPFMFALDSAGQMELEWTSDIHEVSSFSTIAMETPVSIAVNSANEVYEVSNFGGQNDHGVTLRKVSATGENMWSDSAQIPAFAEFQHRAKAIGVDASGNPYVIGFVEQESNQFVFVARFNPTDGAVVWAKTYDFGDTTDLSAAKVLSDGSIVGVGSVNFGEFWGAFKLASDGAVKWERNLGFGTGLNLAVDAAGNIYALGVVEGMEREMVVTKLSGSGQIVWSKTLPNVSLLDDTKTYAPSIAVGTNGIVWVTANRNITNSAPGEFEIRYPIYDSVLVRVDPGEVVPPSVEFTSPSEGTEVPVNTSFPALRIEASSPYGIQKVVIYDDHLRIRAVLTNAPYQVTLGNAELGMTELYAVAYDSIGTAGIAKLTTRIVSPNDTIQLSSGAYRVSETEESVRIVATRTRIDESTMVTLNLTPGSAGASDFSGDPGHEPVTLYFMEGEETADALIKIEKDTIAEADETFTVSLSGPSAGQLGAITSATVTIVDNDSGTANAHGTIEFSEFNFHVVEGVGVVDVTVTRSAGATGAAAVSYFTQPDMARPAWDYLDTSGTIQFAAGETTKTIRMYAVNDATAETAESFYVTLYQPEGGAALGAKWFTLVRIEDDESSTGTATVGFDVIATSVAENAGPAVITVRRTGNVATSASMTYSTRNGTATAGSDYTSASGQITFNPQETVKTITIAINDDSSAEVEENFHIELSAAVNATLGQNKQIGVFITDDDGGNNESTFAGWTETAFTAEERANQSVSGNLADPDGDGYPNIVEYALGLNPKSDDPANILQPTISRENGIVSLRMQFNRPKGRGDLNYLFKSFETLGGAECLLCPEVTTTDNGDGTENVRVELNASAPVLMAFMIFEISLNFN